MTQPLVRCPCGAIWSYDVRSWLAAWAAQRHAPHKTNPPTQPEGDQ